MNDRTLNLLYELDVEDLPERDVWTEPEHADDRFVVIGEEVVGTDVRRGFGGAWATVRDALASYDWNAGPPAFIVDIGAHAERALIPIVLTARTEPVRSFIDAHGGPTLP